MAAEALQQKPQFFSSFSLSPMQNNFASRRALLLALLPDELCWVAGPTVGKRSAVSGGKRGGPFRRKLVGGLRVKGNVFLGRSRQFEFLTYIHITPEYQSSCRKPRRQYSTCKLEAVGCTRVCFCHKVSFRSLENASKMRDESYGVPAPQLGAMCVNTCCC